MTSKRWLILAVVLSLFVNAALIGVLVGRASVGGFEPPLMNPMLGTGRILRDLDPARRDVLKPLLRQHMHDLRPNLREIRAAQSDIRSAIVAEPFDGAALREALDRFQRQLGESQAQGHDSFVAFVAALAPDERALLVKRMHRPPPGAGHPPGGSR